MGVPEVPSEALKPRTFAILLAGHASAYIRQSYGGVAALIRNLLSDGGEVWDTYRVVDGDFPSDDNLDSYEGFIITGSWEDAHGNAPWVLRLCDVVRRAHGLHKKLLGICFGHQVISRALGGKTGRAMHGWEIGLKRVVLTDAMRSRAFAHELPSCLTIFEVHQDEVFELPPGGEVLASSEQTCIEIFAMGNQVLGVQGHPEFTADITLDLLDGYSKKHGIPEDVVSRAKLTLQQGKADQEMLKKMCKCFMKASPCAAQVSTLDLPKRDNLDGQTNLQSAGAGSQAQEIKSRM